jgi:hypothetical protein
MFTPHQQHISFAISVGAAGHIQASVLAASLWRPTEEEATSVRRSEAFSTSIHKHFMKHSLKYTNGPSIYSIGYTTGTYQDGKFESRRDVGKDRKRRWV